MPAIPRTSERTGSPGRRSPARPGPARSHAKPPARADGGPFRKSRKGLQRAEYLFRAGDVEAGARLDGERLDHAVLDDHGIALRPDAEAALGDRKSTRLNSSH